MKQRPIKFRILELYSDGVAHWNSEVVQQIQKEYDMSGDYYRDYINFDMIELVSGGMLTGTDEKIDKEGNYKKGTLLQKYMITDFGKIRASECCIRFL
ncbi:MAG: hypothetical protein RBT65_15165 [Methanolobus sp.]|nr:hypothetical protein [Methanolobus sp.]